jgi:hypothetical protein
VHFRYADETPSGMPHGPYQTGIAPNHHSSCGAIPLRFIVALRKTFDLQTHRPEQYLSAQRGSLSRARRSLTNDTPRSYVNLASARRAQFFAWLIE